MFLVRGLVIGVAGRKHHAFDTEVHHLVEEGADGFGIGSVKKSRVRGHAETAAESFFDGVDGDVVSAFTADGEVVLFALAVEVDRKSQVLTGLEEMDFFFQQQRIGAEIDIFFAGDQAFDDRFDLRVHQGLAAGDGNHGGAAFVDGAETFFGAEIFFEDVGRVLDLAASGAGQVTAEERFQHEDKWILLASGKLLTQHIAAHGPHLRHGYWHRTPFGYFSRNRNTLDGRGTFGGTLILKALNGSKGFTTGATEETRGTTHPSAIPWRDCRHQLLQPSSQFIRLKVVPFRIGSLPERALVRSDETRCPDARL